MRYMKPMKTSFGFDFALCTALALGSLGLVACDKAETKSKESAEVVVADSKAATLTAAKTVEATTAAAAGDEAACDGDKGDKGDKHDGSDCAKKSAESGEGMGCNKWDEAAAAISKQEIPADASWAVLKVDGMTCGGCERRIIANVGKLDGVVAVEADSELGQVRVAVASGSKAATDLASAKISELGYTVQ